jgi:prevent-host-death family protein
MKLSQLVDNVVRRDDEIVITRNGKPVAVIMSSGEYDGWKETQEIKADKELMAEIRKGIKDIEQGESKIFNSLDELFGAAPK